MWWAGLLCSDMHVTWACRHCMCSVMLRWDSIVWKYQYSQTQIAISLWAWQGIACLSPMNHFAELVSMLNPKIHVSILMRIWECGGRAGLDIAVGDFRKSLQFSPRFCDSLRSLRDEDSQALKPPSFQALWLPCLSALRQYDEQDTSASLHEGVLCRGMFLQL